MVCRHALTLFLMLLLTACGVGPPAPVSDRSVGSSAYQRGAKELPDVHVVQRGDTLYSIAFRYNLDHRTLAAWNAIGAPFTIYPQQVLWLRPPQQQRRSAAVTVPAPTPDPAVRKPGPVRNTVPQDTTPSAQQGATDSAASKPAPTATPTKPSTAPAAATAPAGEASNGERVAANIRWVWPVAGGQLSRGFVAADSDRQGVDIGGRLGQPVVAAADGEVVYSGAGFVGYAGLIIIKHNESLLSAYAHNRRRLVVEGDRVKAGQQIAELGQSPRGANEVYVQIRRDGQPQNPLNYLPGH